jgi:hypothetical protein
MITFRSIFQVLGPGWLTSGDGGKVLYSIGVLLDATLERMRQALVLRFPEHAETDEALSYLGRDRQIIRGINEPADRFAARLKAWRYPYGHRVRGNAWSVLDQIRNYFLGAGGSEQATVDRTGNQNFMTADGDLARSSLGTIDFDGGTHWARFVTLVDARPAGIGDSGYTIGDPELWGGTVGNDYVIGLDGAVLADVSTLRQIVKSNKPAGTQAIWLLFLADGSETVDTAIASAAPDGTWGEHDSGNMPNWLRRVSL